MPLFRKRKDKTLVKGKSAPKESAVSATNARTQGSLDGQQQETKFLLDDNCTAKYIVRSPWAWVLEDVAESMDDATAIVQIETPSDFLSKKLVQKDDNAEEEEEEPSPSAATRRRRKKTKKPCTLRLEIENGNTLIEAAHGISEALDGLEDKDELVRTIQRCRCEHLELTPPSQLLNWDVTKEECMNLVGASLPTLLANNQTTEGRVAVLKEPMGSQGTGIFFVKTADEIHGIVEEHRKRAVDETGFLDHLIAMKGRIPSWVLQAEVYPCLLVKDRRKFHIRTYIAAIENLDSDDSLLDVYVYNRHEVRIASQPISFDENGSRDRQSHITNGAGSDSTERLLLEDVPELVERDMTTKVEKFVAQIFGTHFIPDMHKRVGYSASQEDDESMDYVTKFAIAGLDIMVTDDARLYLLEVNVNPAAPPKDTIPPKFQNHLRGFMSDLMNLVVGKDAPNFMPVSDILSR